MQRLFAHCVFRVGSDPTVSPCLCAAVVGPLRELQKSGKGLALPTWWAVIPQSRAALRYIQLQGEASAVSAVKVHHPAEMLVHGVGYG